MKTATDPLSSLLFVGKLSREKGARGEREVVNLATNAGLSAERTALLQSNRFSTSADVALLDFPTLHVEVKRDERMSVDAMVRQAVTDAAKAKKLRTPVVAWRRNKGEWRADVPLTWLLHVLRMLHDAH